MQTLHVYLGRQRSLLLLDFNHQRYVVHAWQAGRDDSHMHIWTLSSHCWRLIRLESGRGISPRQIIVVWAFGGMQHNLAKLQSCK